VGICQACQRRVQTCSGDVKASKNQPRSFSLVGQPKRRASAPLIICPMAQLSVRKHPQQVHYFAEPLTPNIVVKPINMVLILGGTFQMGSPEDEVDRFEYESPQHSVTVPSFFMSEYPIVKAHWWAVAQMPKIKIELKESPSHFSKGTAEPVESVSWWEAVEFCARLSRHSGRIYRLPSEAEWEYACRAGTTTPFHYGETITTDLANYDGTDGKWSGSYDPGPKGIYRVKTTPVDTFPPNAFGLYDMHGNVWEWCEDHWHDNYEGAPTDGSVWISDVADAGRVTRGGSWADSPRDCRSATRINYSPDDRYDCVGFRVVCEIPRTP
jgi:formylglycine-generating enzyme required for sulfatase activity